MIDFHFRIIQAVFETKIKMSLRRLCDVFVLAALNKAHGIPSRNVLTNLPLEPQISLFQSIKHACWFEI